LIYVKIHANNQEFCADYEGFHPHLEDNYLHIKDGSQWYPVDFEGIKSIDFEVSNL